MPDSPFLFLAEGDVEQIATIAVYTATVIDDRDALPEEELVKILEWANDARMRSGLLDNVVSGRTFIRWDSEKQDVTFALSPKGMGEAEALVKQMGTAR